MFLNLPLSQRNHYGNLLGLMGSLSRLFSDNETVYLDYRVVENLFCRSFDARNVSRSDVAVDAILGNIGVGIKTFTLGNKNTYSYEKIAEFSRLESAHTNESLIQRIATIRNERLAFAQRNYGIQELVYHCVTRRQSLIQIFEFGLNPIQFHQINIQKLKDNSIFFDDGFNQYRFSQSKSTVYLKFDCDKPLYEIQVNILQDPFDLLEQFLREQVGDGAVVYPTAYLPLYSIDKGRKIVPPHSGLNHWNANGEKRKRQPNEIYIPVRREFHNIMQGFFPPRDIHFTLHLPNGEKMTAKLCQDGMKALMSNPNGALGDWLLRHVLNLKEGELLTYDYLLKLGIDSLIFQKIGDLDYTIDFAPVGAYERFITEQGGQS